MDTVDFTNRLSKVKNLIEQDGVPALDIVRAAGFKNSQALVDLVGIAHKNTLTNWRNAKPDRYMGIMLGAAALKMLGDE